MHTLSWSQVKHFLEKRIADLDKENHANLDPIETAGVRGAIAECERLLKLPSKINAQQEAKDAGGFSTKY